MSSVFPARRRAERFDALVQGVDSPGAPGAPHWPRALGALGGTNSEGADSAVFVDLLVLVGELRALPEVQPAAEFSSRLRSALMAEADQVLVIVDRELAPPVTRRPGQRRKHRRLAVAVSALTLVGATASVSYASQHALPGDALYPVKRAIENAQTGMASGPSKTQDILDNASARLDEARALAAQDSIAGDARVPATIHDFTEQAEQGGSRALQSGDDDQLTALRTFTSESMAQLEELDALVPDQARDELAAAARLVADLDAQAVTSCPSCGGAVLDLPPIFLTPSAASAPLASSPNVSTTPPKSQPTTPPSSQPSASPTSDPTGDAPTSDNQAPGGGSPPSSTPKGQGPIQHLTEDLLPSAPGHSNPLAPIVSPVVSPLASTIDGVLDGVDDLLGGP